MAATNKCLAQSNKSGTGSKATKKRRSLPAIEAEAREDDNVKMAEFCTWWSE
jgi:hypothetical protein